MRELDNISKERLRECHKDINTIFRVVNRIINIGVACGHRGQIKQNTAFKIGASKVEWPNSKHNTYPSLAVDVFPFPYNPSNTKRFYYLIGVVIAVAELLYEQVLVTHKIRSGGDWDCDSDLDDQSFNDLMHFELYKPEEE